MQAAVAAEDIELMGRYVAGDADAFRQLYRRVAPRLLGYLTRMAKDRALAEDLLQLTFLKAHRARKAYVRDADPMPWLYAIAHHAFLDEARKRKRAKVELSRTEAGPPEARAHVSGKPEDVAADAEPSHDPELAQAALTALQTLPPSQREAIILTKLDGKSIAEAAAITGTTPGAMKVRAHRGYLALRKALGAEGGGS